MWKTALLFNRKTLTVLLLLLRKVGSYLWTRCSFSLSILYHLHFKALEVSCELHCAVNYTINLDKLLSDGQSNAWRESHYRGRTTCFPFVNHLKIQSGIKVVLHHCIHTVLSTEPKGIHPSITTNHTEKPSKPLPSFYPTCPWWWVQLIDSEPLRMWKRKQNSNSCSLLAEQLS